MSKKMNNLSASNTSSSNGLQPTRGLNSSIQKQRRMYRRQQSGYTLNFHTLVQQVYAYANSPENFIVALNPIFWIGTTPSTVACAHSNYQLLRLGVTFVSQLGNNDGGNLQMGVQMANSISFDPVARSSSTSYTAIPLASRRYTTWLDIAKLTTTLKFNTNDSSNMPVLVCNINWLPVSQTNSYSLVGELYFEGTIVFSNPTNVVLNPIASVETLANIISNPNRTSNDSMYVIREPSQIMQQLYLKAMSGTSTIGPIFLRLLKLGQRIVKKVTENAVQIIIQEFASEFSKTEISSIMTSIAQADEEPLDAKVQVFGFNNDVVTVSEPEPIFSIEIIGTPKFAAFSDITEGYILTHSMDIIPVDLLKEVDDNCKLSPESYWINLDILRINDWPGETENYGWWCYAKEQALRVYNHLYSKMESIFKSALNTCGIEYFCFMPHRYHEYNDTGTIGLTQYFIDILGSFLMPSIAGDKVYYSNHALWVLPTPSEPSTGEEVDEKYTYVEAYPVPNCTTYGNGTLVVQRQFPLYQFMAAYNMCYDRQTYQTIPDPNQYFADALDYDIGQVLLKSRESQPYSSSSSSST